jgi:dihydroorotate dehydrogenase electron transfer subunit
MLRGDWGRDPLLPRAFSLLEVGIGGKPGRADVLVKTAGRGTALLEKAAPGVRLSLLGPLGRPFPTDATTDALCVAGGVGLAPLLLLAGQLRAAGASPAPELHYGARCAHDLCLLSECEAAFGRVLCATEDGSAGERGFVTAITERRLKERIAETGRAPLVLACGPTPMMEAVARLAAAHDARCLVSLEGPMACGFGVCLGCAVPTRAKPYSYVCTDGPVFDAAELRAWP